MTVMMSSLCTEEIQVCTLSCLLSLKWFFSILIFSIVNNEGYNQHESSLQASIISMRVSETKSLRTTAIANGEALKYSKQRVTRLVQGNQLRSYYKALTKADPRVHCKEIMSTCHL